MTFNFSIFIRSPKPSSRYLHIFMLERSDNLCFKMVLDPVDTSLEDLVLRILGYDPLNFFDLKTPIDDSKNCKKSQVQNPSKFSVLLMATLI